MSIKLNAHSFQAMLVPIAEALLGWTEKDTSIFFSAAGVLVQCNARIVALSLN